MGQEREKQNGPAQLARLARTGQLTTGSTRQRGLDPKRYELNWDARLEHDPTGERRRRLRRDPTLAAMVVGGRRLTGAPARLGVDAAGGCQ
jgi:hypothetical protein